MFQNTGVPWLGTPKDARSMFQLEPITREEEAELIAAGKPPEPPEPPDPPEPTEPEPDDPGTPEPPPS